MVREREECVLGTQYMAWCFGFKVGIGVPAVPATPFAPPPGPSVVLFALPFTEFTHHQSFE